MFIENDKLYPRFLIPIFGKKITIVAIFTDLYNISYPVKRLVGLVVNMYFTLS